MELVGVELEWGIWVGEGVEPVGHMGREMGGAIVSGGQSLRQEGVELEWGMVGRWAGL